MFNRKKDPEALYFEDLERRKENALADEPDEPEEPKRSKKRKRAKERRLPYDLLEIAAETVIELILDSLD